MATPINTEKTTSAGVVAGDWIPMNRWSIAEYSAYVAVTGTITYQIEGTLNKINQGETAVAFILDDASGAAISGKTTTSAYDIGNAPVEAIRINQTAGTGSTTIRVMQSGAD